MKLNSLTIHAIVYNLADLVLHITLGLIVLSVNKTLGILVIGSHVIRSAAKYLYAYNDLKQKEEDFLKLLEEAQRGTETKSEDTDDTSQMH
jgi:hypothetical protein